MPFVNPFKFCLGMAGRKDVKNLFNTSMRFQKVCGTEAVDD